MHAVVPACSTITMVPLWSYHTSYSTCIREKPLCFHKPAVFRAQHHYVPLCTCSCRIANLQAARVDFLPAPVEKLGLIAKGNEVKVKNIAVYHVLNILNKVAPYGCIADLINVKESNSTFR